MDRSACGNRQRSALRRIGLSDDGRAKTTTATTSATTTTSTAAGAQAETGSPPPPPPPPPPPAPKVERTIILDDVLFDFDKSNVKPEAGAILDRLVAFMNENKDKKVNLSGHTDNVGTEAYNQALSERRVNSVRDYVVKKGVDAGRVSGQGFGESKPIADNKTREGRAKNRRVEIKVN